MNTLKELIIENENILYQKKIEGEIAPSVFQRLSKDIIDKSKSILVLYEAKLYVGIPSIARSVLESYVYMKYIFEDNYTCAAKSEAYYIKGLLDEINFFENVNTDELIS